MSRLFRILNVLCAAWLCITCTGKKVDSEAAEKDTINIAACAHHTQEPLLQEKSAIAHQLDSLGFLNIAICDPSILIELKYATPDNFTGKQLYRDLHEAYLHPKAMESLKQAQRLLQTHHPDLSLKVYDAARPLSVQQEMWEMVAGTKQSIYVSNPRNGGGLHNYGMAVDVTIVNIKTQKELPMGTAFDHFGEEAHIDKELKMVETGKITAEEWANRLLLRQTMLACGWITLKAEWWHFNRVSKTEAQAHYPIIP